jgi:hypothetical protein
VTSGPELDLDLDDLPWVVGPTEARPFERWLPEAVALMTQLFAMEPNDMPPAEEYLTAMLTRIGQSREDSLLPYRLIRWLHPEDLPVVACFGLVERGTAREMEDFLAGGDAAPVEQPIIDVLEADRDRTVRRSQCYSQPDAGLVVELRYVVDDAHPDLVALIHVTDRSPGALAEARDDLDQMAHRMRIR